MDCKQPPFPRDASEELRTAILEADSRTRHQIFHCRRDKELPRFRGRGNASSDMNGDATYSPLKHLALASMDARSESNSQIRYALDDVARTCHSLGRAFEGR